MDQVFERGHRMLISSWKGLEFDGFCVKEDSGVVYTLSGAPDLYFNAILDMPPKHLISPPILKTLKIIVNSYQQDKKGCVCWVKDKDYEGYQTFLEQENFQKLGHIETLALDLKDLNFERSSKAPLKIKNSQDFPPWFSVFQEAFELSKTGSSLFSTLLENSIPKDTFIHYYLLFQDKITSILSVMMLENDDIGLFNFGTFKAQRNKGHLSELVVLCLMEARKRGKQTAIVHANQASQSLLKKLGFKKVGSYGFYGRI